MVLPGGWLTVAGSWQRPHRTQAGPVWAKGCGELSRKTQEYIFNNNNTIVIIILLLLHGYTISRLDMNLIYRRRIVLLLLWFILIPESLGQYELFHGVVSARVRFDGLDKVVVGLEAFDESGCIPIVPDLDQQTGLGCGHLQGEF